MRQPRAVVDERHARHEGGRRSVTLEVKIDLERKIGNLAVARLIGDTHPMSLHARPDLLVAAGGIPRSPSTR